MATQEEIRNLILALIKSIECGDAYAETEASYSLNEMIKNRCIVGEQAILIENCFTVDDPEAITMLRLAVEY